MKALGNYEINGKNVPFNILPSLEKKVSKPCKCGCNKMTVAGNDYIIGHNLKTTYNKNRYWKTHCYLCGIKKRTSEKLMLCDECEFWRNKYLKKRNHFNISMFLNTIRYMIFNTSHDVNNTAIKKEPIKSKSPYVLCYTDNDTFNKLYKIKKGLSWSKLIETYNETKKQMYGHKIIKFGFSSDAQRTELYNLKSVLSWTGLLSLILSDYKKPKFKVLLNHNIENKLFYRDDRFERTGRMKQYKEDKKGIPKISQTKVCFTHNSNKNNCKDCWLYIKQMKECIIIKGTIYDTSSCNFYTPKEPYKNEGEI